MTERPILFSAPMVRAILDGTKTQTRRVVKGRGWEPHHLTQHQLVQHTDPRAGLQAYFRESSVSDWMGIACPYGQPGDQLWVRETFQRFTDDGETIYKADPKSFDLMNDLRRDECLEARWRPAIHMPRWASRITLSITNVRVERLQDISEADAAAEGASAKHTPDANYTAREAYAALWEQINGGGSWDANPWVWVVEFTRTK